MSGKKLELKKFFQYRRKHKEICGSVGDGYMDIPLDFDEFNKMFFSKRNVILEYNRKKPYGALCACGLYAGLKVAKSGYNICFCNYAGRDGFPFISRLAQSICGHDCSKNFRFQYESIPEREVVAKNLVDEWVLDASYAQVPSFGDKFKTDCDRIFHEILRTKGFQNLGDYDLTKRRGNRVVVGWEGLERKNPNKKFIVAWDNRAKEQLKEVLEKFPDRFLLIPYSREKKLVDDWYSKNETIVDPEFDIQLMDPSIDVRKTLMYVATNHLYDFRNFAKVLPEVVNENFSKDELRELL